MFVKYAYKMALFNVHMQSALIEITGTMVGPGSMTERWPCRKNAQKSCESLSMISFQLVGLNAVLIQGELENQNFSLVNNCESGHVSPDHQGTLEDISAESGLSHNLLDYYTAG